MGQKDGGPLRSICSRRFPNPTGSQLPGPAHIPRTRATVVGGHNREIMSLPSTLIVGPSLLAAESATAVTQEDRELAEALRVQAMSPVERSAWLRGVWGRVQRNAAALQAHAPAHEPTARSYATMDEKNRFDEARELAFALRHSVYATQRTSPAS